MNRSIHSALVGLVLFLVAYCLCFWFGVMPKYYPLLGEIHIVPPEGKPIAVKFVGSALVGFLAGLIGVWIGRRVPERSASYLHALVWLVMIAACVYLFGRETAEYILG